MLVDVAEVMALEGYENANPEAVKRKILGIESAIRAYTNNSFIVRESRMVVPSENGMLSGTDPYIKGGSRVLIDGGANEGLYDVESVQFALNYTALDETLQNAESNTVFLVKYPEAVKSGVLELLRWEASGRDKVGVASETISRHSVTYYQFGDAEMLMGYPAALMGFLKPFVKARF